MARGQSFCIRKGEGVFIRALDNQRAKKKTMFGCGYLISEKAVAEVWKLSEREKEIIANLK